MVRLPRGRRAAEPDRRRHAGVRPQEAGGRPCRALGNHLVAEGELGMDREAAVIRSEMSQTRADLDRKLAALEAKAHDMSPRRVVQRNLPEYFWERAIGSVLTLV